MNSDYYEDAAELVRSSFSALDKEAVDRLSKLESSFRLRNAIYATLRFLDPLTDPDLSSEYPMEDLETILVHLKQSARPLRELLEHFIEKARLEAEKFQLAV